MPAPSRSQDPPRGITGTSASAALACRRPRPRTRPRGAATPGRRHGRAGRIADAVRDWAWISMFLRKDMMHLGQDEPRGHANAPCCRTDTSTIHSQDIGRAESFLRRATRAGIPLAAGAGFTGFVMRESLFFHSNPCERGRSRIAGVIGVPAYRPISNAHCVHRRYEKTAIPADPRAMEKFICARPARIFLCIHPQTG